MNWYICLRGPTSRKERMLWNNRLEMILSFQAKCGECFVYFQNIAPSNNIALMEAIYDVMCKSHTNCRGIQEPKRFIHAYICIKLTFTFDIFPFHQFSSSPDALTPPYTTYHQWCSRCTMRQYWNKAGKNCSSILWRLFSSHAFDSVAACCRYICGKTLRESEKKERFVGVYCQWWNERRCSQNDLFARCRRIIFWHLL